MQELPTDIIHEIPHPRTLTFRQLNPLRSSVVA
jgi:hypothetical protein